MVRRTASYGASVLVSILLVLAIVVFANFISSLYFTRADLTQDKMYTVSDPTKAVLKGLEDLVTIQLYFSKDLPSYVAPLRTSIKDLLSEYKAYSGGNVQVETIDPADDPELQQKMQFMGIPPVQLNVIERDKAEVVTVYMGLAVLYENKKEVIPVIQSTQNLEYQLTSAISKVTMKEVKTVGLLALSEDRPVEGSFSGLKEALEKQYDVRDIDFTRGARDLKSVDTLIVFGSRQLSDWEEFQIDQAVMRGANVIFLTDMVKREKGKLDAKAAETNINDLLENYGVRVNQNLVLDRSAGMAAFSSGFMSFSLPYNFWVKVGSKGLSEDNAAVKQLSSVIFPWTSSVEALPDRNPDASFEVLAKSSDASWLQAGQFDLSPQQRTEPSAFKSHNLAIEASGKFKSLFAGREAPKPEDEASARFAGKDQEVIEESPVTKIVVIGGSFLVDDEFLNRYRKNDLFVQNLVDVLTLGKGLVGIRSRGATERPIEEVSESAKSWIKYGNTFGIPFLVAAFGLTRFYWRKKRKRAL